MAAKICKKCKHSVKEMKYVRELNREIRGAIVGSAEADAEHRRAYVLGGACEPCIKESMR